MRGGGRRARLGSASERPASGSGWQVKRRIRAAVMGADARDQKLLYMPVLPRALARRFGRAARPAAGRPSPEKMAQPPAAPATLSRSPTPEGTRLLSFARHVIPVFPARCRQTYFSLTFNLSFSISLCRRHDGEGYFEPGGRAARRCPAGQTVRAAPPERGGGGARPARENGSTARTPPEPSQSRARP